MGGRENISLQCLVYLFGYFLFGFFGVNKIEQESNIDKKYCPNSLFLQTFLRPLTFAADEEANARFLDNNAEFCRLTEIFPFILTLTESCNEGVTLDVVFKLIFRAKSTNLKLCFFPFPHSFLKIHSVHILSSVF